MFQRSRAKGKRVGGTNSRILKCLTHTHSPDRTLIPIVCVCVCVSVTGNTSICCHAFGCLCVRRLIHINRYIYPHRTLGEVHLKGSPICRYVLNNTTTTRNARACAYFIPGRAKGLQRTAHNPVIDGHAGIRCCCFFYVYVLVCI